MSKTIYFDDALPVFSALVKQEWGDDGLTKNFFLRDVTGRVTLIVLDKTKSTESRSALANKAILELPSYVDGDGFSVATPDELFDERLSNISVARDISLNHTDFKGPVKLLDRRMVGADWLRDPSTSAKPPMRLVFASIKGGVGRSTALCVVAAHLASQGRRVLAIDMDLEAPGLGNMLLPDATLPEFGLLDYLVEHNLKALDDEFFADMVGPSWLGGGRGRVDVVPAIGRRSLAHPSNVLAKIARAYLGGGGDAAGEVLSSFTDQMSSLLNRIANPQKYDVVLLDARAGLHETTAAGVVGLGAEVLLFGIDQPQTIAGYELLFAHLGTLSIDLNDDWRSRMRFIQAKASENKALQDEFSSRIEYVMKKHLLPSSDDEISVDVSTLKDTFEVEWSDSHNSEDLLKDEDIFPPVIAILSNDRFQSFDPMNDRDSLNEKTYLFSFGDLISTATAMVDSSLKTGRT